ncbi:MAG TPA: helix-turn-helix transcriptional regulator [Pyrinomonadaceae bacterium]|nr:helix-turn-helix transcriptional regulator [Pyrinomonadaceae bacterium]
MDRDKQKRLEEAGWQVGSVADFLGLTREESIYIELRVLLAEALKARRQAAKLSQKAFAKVMKSSQSRIAKAEANDPKVSIDLLVRSLIALGVSLTEIGRILELQEADFKYDSGTARRSSKRKQPKQPAKKAKKGTAKAA